MLITKLSPLTRTENTLEIDITQEQLNRYLSDGGLIQIVFPNLTPDEREFILTGYTKEDWDKIMNCMNTGDWDNEP
jgi:hypothetical protein